MHIGENGKTIAAEYHRFRGIFSSDTGIVCRPLLPSHIDRKKSMKWYTFKRTLLFAAAIVFFQVLCSELNPNSQPSGGEGIPVTQNLETASPLFKRIAHVSLKTSDLQKSIDYYTKLGFSVKFMFTKQGMNHGVYLQIAPGNFIEIFEDKNLGAVVNNGIAHFCLETESMDSVMEKLSAVGVPFTQKKFGCDSSWQIWLSDPDGNQFEVHEYTGSSMQLKDSGSVEIDW